MTTPFRPDPSHFSLTGAYYPTGHVFAMFNEAAAARAVVAELAKVHKVGEVRSLPPDSIVQAFAERSASVGGMPSVGREDQFMLRYVELAQQGKAGVLVEMGDAASDEVGAVLAAAGALLAYHYRALVIEELVEASTQAEAAASGKL